MEQTYLFRCSRLSELMVGNIGLTTKQRADLELYRLRLSDANSKPLTDKMISDMAELIKKEETALNGEISEGSKTFCEYTYLKNKYQYNEEIVTDEMMKGLLLESLGITFLSNHLNDGLFRKKNTTCYKNDHIIGTPDIIITDQSEKIIEDIKISSNLRTFLDACTQKVINKKYYWQGMGYMWLTGATKFRLAYVLLPDIETTVEESKKRFYFKFGCDEENEDYKKICNQIDMNNEAVEKVSIEKRVKIYEFERDDDQIKLIENQVNKARKYIETLEEIL